MYLTIQQVAAIRVCNEQIVRNAVLCGRIPAWVIGGIYLIPRAEGEDWGLKRTTIITDRGKVKTIREYKLRKLQDAAALRAIEQGKVIRRVDAPPEIPGRCLG